MRVILGGFFAVVLTRLFYGKVAPLYVAGLAVFLVAMSYVTEYFRNKSRKKSLGANYHENTKHKTPVISSSAVDEENLKPKLNTLK
jgi:hypothetical protein